MKEIMEKVKAIYLEIKGVEYKHLTEKQKEFLKELQYQACLMKDFCRPLSESEIVSLIENCETDVQLEIALRRKKIA